MNRYTSIGGNSIAYDYAGNMTTDENDYTYTYDYENRIIEIKDSSSTTVAEYAYDALGRRIKKVAGSETTLYYHNNNWQVLAQYDDADNFESMNIFGNYIDEIIYRQKRFAPSQRYYVHDHLYSPVAVVDRFGDIKEGYEYDVYGNCQVMTVYGLQVTM